MDGDRKDPEPQKSVGLGNHFGRSTANFERCESTTVLLANGFGRKDILLKIRQLPHNLSIRQKLLIK